MISEGDFRKINGFFQRKIFKKYFVSEGHYIKTNELLQKEFLER